MENQNDELISFDKDDVQILSRRNQKRFNKLLPQIEQRIISLKNENQSLAQEIAASKTPEVVEAKELVSEYDKAYKDYLAAQIDSEETEKQLSPLASASSNYSSEIIWFSVIIGLVFDFLLWKDIFAGKFGSDAWAERAERASAIILSFSYAFICAQLGASYAIKIFTKKRSESTNQKEIEIYNKYTSKNSLGINLFLFTLLTILSTSARFTQNSLNISDKFILSLAATSIGLVISAIGYWYTDVYEHYIKIAKNKELKAKKNFYRLKKIAKDKNNAD